ncbi:uncharacterized protein LOC119454159 [Dermacentor silvarum]|uniref:uncharacterized protein LOC119454159 n=1 Tax=Dermacentor silvarum TaxID=543639 RepID=UPI0021012361|nr:uncharacterized protein LOC119454159 [Dermacentor silvarum]
MGRVAAIACFSSSTLIVAAYGTATTTKISTTTTEKASTTTRHVPRPQRPDFGLYFDANGCKHKVLSWYGDLLTVTCQAECNNKQVQVAQGTPCAQVVNPGTGAARFGSRVCRIGTCMRNRCLYRGRREVCSVPPTSFHRSYRRHRKRSYTGLIIKLHCLLGVTIKIISMIHLRMTLGGIAFNIEST